MATYTATVGTDWLEIGTGLTIALVQARGDLVAYMGGTAPGAADTGFDISTGIPVLLPNLDSFGGGLWVRSEGGEGGVTYAAA